MTDRSKLDAAYALESPEDNRRLYAGWSDTYEADFAQAMGYRLPQAVADGYAARSLSKPVLDLGAGTGLVGVALAAHGVTEIDGTDIAPEMLERARQKGVYRQLFPSDLTQALDLPDAAYAGAVSAGTFTHGHVGPEALEEVLRIVRPGGWIVLSVNARHWDRMGFDAALDRLAPRIAAHHREDIAIYEAGAPGAHARDRAWLLSVQVQVA